MRRRGGIILNKSSNCLLRMIVSIRNTLDEISNEKITSSAECRRLEQLDKVFTSTLFYTLIDEIEL